jgi:hypothetical protein
MKSLISLLQSPRLSRVGDEDVRFINYLPSESGGSPRIYSWGGAAADNNIAPAGHLV